MYSIVRPATSAGQGRTTFIYGQATTDGSNPTGGDVLIDGGTAATTNGRILLGTQSSSVTIGQSGKTTTVAGALSASSFATPGTVSANALTVVGAVSSGSLLTGVITASSVTSQGAVTNTGRSVLVGSVLMGGNSAYSLTRSADWWH